MNNEKYYKGYELWYTLNFWVFNEHQNGVNSLQLCGHRWDVNLHQTSLQNSVKFTPKKCYIYTVEVLINTALWTLKWCLFTQH